MAARTSADLQRVLDLLRGLIRLSDLSQTEVDERIRRRRGYLSHVFQQVVDLKVKDLLLALSALEIHPIEFFDTALGGDTSRPPSAGDVLALFQNSQSGRSSPVVRRIDRGLPGPDPATARRAETSHELRDRVTRVVREILEELPPGSLEQLRHLSASGQ